MPKVVVAIVHKLPPQNTYSDVIKAAQMLKDTCTTVIVEYVYGRPKDINFAHAIASQDLTASRPHLDYYSFYTSFSSMANSGSLAHRACS